MRTLSIGKGTVRAALLATLLLAGCRPTGDEAGTAGGTEPAADQPAQAAPAAGVVERGRYLVTVASCNDCHTPMTMGPNGPQPDTTRLLSGHPENLTMPPAPLLPAPWGYAGSLTNTAFSGPWGMSYANNLTPDEDTGIGVWTEEIFVNTLRSGRHWGVARPILPPMPWPSYAQMTDEDLKAIYAYLRSIPPIHNRTPESQPAPPPEEPGAAAAPGPPAGQPGTPPGQPAEPPPGSERP